MVASISPDESMAIVRINSVDGYTLWNRDSDGDGLIDSIDECPGTNLNIEVNERGCGGDQLDDDGDGLANFEDLCPDSLMELQLMRTVVRINRWTRISTASVIKTLRAKVHQIVQVETNVLAVYLELLSTPTVAVGLNKTVMAMAS